jgi:signal transduction histidine kinase
MPLILVSALVFVFILSKIEAVKSREVNIAFAKDLGARDAALIAESLWNIENARIGSILQTVSKERKVRCVEVRDKSGWNDGVRKGNCVNLKQFYQVIAPIQFQGEILGQLSLWFDVSVDHAKLVNDDENLISLVVVLLFVLVICVVMGFSVTILKPLGIVYESLKHFKIDGIRRQVDWHTDDELGRFIKEYNSTIQRETEAERALIAAKDKAEQALARLEQAQESLVQSEKMASLGSLVAGIAHEINTPIGNSLTVATTLDHKVKSFHRQIDSGGLKKSALMSFLSEAEEATQIMEKSLNAAAEQIQNFKQVAVDQTSAQRREFDLKEVAQEVISTLKPRIKHTEYSIEIDIQESILLESYPGPLGQVISNCFNNAVLHGFDGIASGQMTLKAEKSDEEHVAISFKDTGKGISSEHLKKIFDPFFTTKMGEGGSGLGMNLVYNIVTSILGGNISVISEPGQGTEVKILIPLVAPQDHAEDEAINE